MTTLYKDKHHLVILLEKDGVFKIWARVGNPRVSVSKRYRPWELTMSLIRTPVGIYNQVVRDTLFKINNVEKFIETQLINELTCGREVEQLDRNPKLVKSIVDECLTTIKIQLFPELMP